VAAAIDTIAELGYGQASVARIAEKAGTSKGVILYHFDGKDDLIKEVAAEVSAKVQEYMRPRVLAESTGTGMLRAWIESNLAFMGEYRHQVVAAVEIVLNARSADGRRLFDVPAAARQGVTDLQQMLAHFQGTGEFRAGFDPLVMAMAIRAAIDAVPPRLIRDPDFDVAHYARELADLFHIATRAEACRGGPATSDNEQSAEE
jgi:AcrR family transcriptional regulator